MRRILLGIGLVLMPALAYAVAEFPSAGGPVGAYMMMWWTGSVAIQTSAANPMPVSVGATLSVNDVALSPLSLTFASTIAGSSTALFSGGTASHNLVAFNNTVTGGATLWCNPGGGAAVAGTGIPIPPGGGGYVWAKGLTTVPNCIAGTAIGGTSSQTVLVSGSGG